MSRFAPSDEEMLGRFVVDLPDQRATDLSAEEALELLAAHPPGAAQAYVVHRVDAAGRMEMAGVSDAELRRGGIVVVARATIKDARRDYDLLAEWAGRRPPPCGLRMRLCNVRLPAPYRAVALEGPAVCMDAVRVWMARAGIVAEGADAAVIRSREEFENVAQETIVEIVLAARPVMG